MRAVHMPMLGVQAYNAPLGIMRMIRNDLTLARCLPLARIHALRHALLNLKHLIDTSVIWRVCPFRTFLKGTCWKKY